MVGILSTTFIKCFVGPRNRDPVQPDLIMANGVEKAAQKALKTVGRDHGKARLVP